MMVHYMIRLLLRSKAGRHKLWASTKFPWETRASYYNRTTIDEDAWEVRKATGDTSIRFLNPDWSSSKYEFLPEPEFWGVVFTTARVRKIRRVKALLEMLDTPFDPLADPPHPLCRMKVTA